MVTMKILVHSDDRTAGRVLASRLSARDGLKGVCFRSAEDGEIESLQDSDKRDPVGILVTGPGADRICREIRGMRIDLPLIAALKEASPALVVALLDAGCDDAIRDGADAEEVAARFRAVSRRASGLVTNQVKIGALVIRLDGRDPEYDGKRVRLSKIESAILDTLARRAGHPVSREALFARVWPDSDKQPFDKVLDVHLHNLRKKLSAASGGRRYIETIPARGYFLERRQRENQHVTVQEPALANA